MSDKQAQPGVREAGTKDAELGAAHEAVCRPCFLGLDIGSRRIGVAVSDGLGLTAQPVLTLLRKKPRDDVRSLARLARRFECTAIVAGLPVHMSGEAGAQAGKVRALAEELGRYSGLPIHYWDERLTTREAHQMLYEAGRPREQHRAVVDQVAAVLILQGFLDAQPRIGEAGHGAGQV